MKPDIDVIVAGGGMVGACVAAIEDGGDLNVADLSSRD